MAQRQSRHSDNMDPEGTDLTVVRDWNALGDHLSQMVKDYEQLELTPEQRLDLALSAIGAWRDLDGDALLEAIEAGRRERRPTPPIDDL